MSIQEVADILPACSFLLRVIIIEWDGDLLKVSFLAGDVGFLLFVGQRVATDLSVVY